MKKIFIGLGVCILLLVVSVFATAAQEVSDEISEVVDEVSTGGIAEEVQEYVEEFVEKRGIEAQDITDISEVNFDDLPKEVNIENVNDANLAIYEIDYKEEEKEKQIFVVTYSVEQLRAQGDLIIAHDKRQFLNFGFDGDMSAPGFLETATGVEGSLEKGYVMMREGSITGVSTNLEVIDGNDSGKIEIIIYKNGESIRFGNTLDAVLGVKKDYDVQSRDTVTFEPGDIISVYVNAERNIVWRDVITMIEITTIN
jgi:hypothetical protein